MTPRRLTTLYIKALTATWILVIVPLTMGAYSCTAYQRRSERYLSTGVTARNGLLRGRHASIDNAQGASSDQGGAAWKDTQAEEPDTRTLRGEYSIGQPHAGVTGTNFIAGIKPGRHLEVLSQWPEQRVRLGEESSSAENVSGERPGGQPYEVTAYSHNCTLPIHGHDKVARRAANGRWPIADVTIAADPSIPFGTELLIEGLGFRTVGDRGSAIKGRRVDVFVDSCAEALKFGRRWLRVYPVPPETSKEAEW